jgi:hypothetical protein
VYVCVCVFVCFVSLCLFLSLTYFSLACCGFLPPPFPIRFVAVVTSPVVAVQCGARSYLFFCLVLFCSADSFPASFRSFWRLVAVVCLDIPAPPSSPYPTPFSSLAFSQLNNKAVSAPPPPLSSLTLLLSLRVFLLCRLSFIVL